MKRISLLVVVVVVALMTAPGVFAQQVYENYTAQRGVLQYGPGAKDQAPYGPRGYMLTMPDGAVAGTVVDLEDYRSSGADTTTYGAFQREALKRGYAFLAIATGKPMDWYFDKSSLRFVDAIMQDTFTKYSLPNKNVYLIGVMTSGHRALKYIEYCKKGWARFQPGFRGVILSECAIDWVRMWYEGQKQIRDHETPVSAAEGGLVHYLFDQHLHATPASDIGKYIDFSPYSYFDLAMKKPALFADLSIRAYTFADIGYWFAAKGKGIYDSNYPDMSGFINEQKLAGNKNAELIVFNSKLDEPPGERMRRQSATWDLVDKKELVEWMVKQGE